MPKRVCQFHEERPAVARLSGTSVAGTPIVRDVCEECFETENDGMELLGRGFEEIEWFDEEYREQASPVIHGE